MSLSQQVNHKVTFSQIAGDRRDFCNDAAVSIDKTDVDAAVEAAHPGRRLKAWREDLGWTVDELAERSGADKASISRIEGLATFGRSTTLAKLALAFGRRLHELLVDDQRGVREDGAAPVDGTVAAGTVASVTLASLALPAGSWSHEQPTEFVVVEGAGPGWCAIRVQGHLTSDRADFPVVLEAGDLVVMRPLGDALPESGQILAVARDEDSFEMELRLYVLEGKRHTLWPLSADQRIDELVDPWRAVAVAVEQRRKL